DEYRGEDPLAFVVLKADARGKVTEEQLAEWCRDNMAVYKAPRQVRFVESLPKTATGKLLKRVLRDQAAALKAKRTSGPPPPAWRAAAPAASRGAAARASRCRARERRRCASGRRGTAGSRSRSGTPRRCPTRAARSPRRGSSRPRSPAPARSARPS